MALGTFKEMANNLVLQNVDYRIAGNYTDDTKIFNLLGGKDTLQRNHLGTLTLFNQFQLISAPLMNMTELQKNILYVNGDDGEFTFDVPYTGQMPTVRDYLSADEPYAGQDGRYFQAVIGDGGPDPIFQKNHVITPDLRDGQQFLVIDVGNRVGEGFLYTLQLVTTDKFEYVNTKYFQTGVQFYMVGSLIGQYDEEAPGLGQSAGTIRLLHRIGARRAVKMTITGGAQRLKLDGLSGMDSGDAAKFEGMVAPFLDPKNPNFMMAFGYNNGMGKIDTSKPSSIVPMLEFLLYKELIKQGERQNMWGNAGQTQDQRNHYKLQAAGLYQQMKAGNWRQIPKYTIDVIKSIFSQIFQNRPDIADVDRYLHFQCGRGAVSELTRIMTKEGINIVNALGVVLDNKSLNILRGSGPMNLEAGYRFNRVFLSGFGWLSFEHNPAIDAEFNRFMNEEKIGGLPKFSYTSLIMDVTQEKSTNAFKASPNVSWATGYDKGSNLYMVRNAGMPGIKVSYVDGRTSPRTSSAGKNVVSSLFDGYTVFMEEQSSVWLRDPGRSLLITLQ